ncbi:MAG TPA: LecA/PA-IL family lectin [Vicinamibacterales bacterium]|nr:LecA/PA-IL family lectin [Vicinamibacterales bacterium]
MIHRVLLGSALAAGMSLVAMAGHPATFVLRSGEQVSGELSYKGGTSYTLNGKDYPSGDIALIEFVPGPPPQAELQQVPGVDNNPNELERHVFVTRGGELIFGKIYRISEDGNVFTYDRREGGRQDIPSDQLARVYVNPAGARTVYASVLNAPAATPTPAPAPAPAPPAAAVATAGTTIRVPANQAWTDTGILVNQGDRVAFRASGEITYGRSAGQTATPDGGPDRKAQYPIPSLPVGALLGKVGASAPFAIGTQTQPLPMPASGRLFLGINDNELTDNAGFYTVIVTRQ